MGLSISGIKPDTGRLKINTKIKYDNIPNLGVTWVEKTSQFGSNSIQDITYGNGIYVAVGASGNISTSADGSTWVARGSGQSQAIYGVTFANNLFVAVGANGALVTSSNGVSWTPRSYSSVERYLFGVCYTGTSYVAVGNNSLFLTSTNGTSWTRNTDGGIGGSQYDFKDIAYGDGKLVAVGSNGTNAISTDNGSTWTLTTNDVFTDVDSYLSIIWDGRRFVTCGTGGKIAISYDGIQWFGRTSPFGASYNNYSISFGNGIYTVTSSIGQIKTSNNLADWTTQTSNLGNTTINATYYHDGKFYIGSSNGKLAVSPA